MHKREKYIPEGLEKWSSDHKALSFQRDDNSCRVFVFMVGLFKAWTKITPVNGLMLKLKDRCNIIILNITNLITRLRILYLVFSVLFL